MYGSEQPDWGVWIHVPEATVWEAVALSLNIEPMSIARGRSWREYVTRNDSDGAFTKRLLVATRNLGAEKILRPISYDQGLGNYSIDLGVFANWAIGIKWDVPGQFAEIATRAALSPAETKASRWPWGQHETELLRQLAAASQKFWSNYDPADPSTAPTNQQISDWLEAKGVSNRVAEIMAQILRADGLPTGPRK